MSDIPPLEDPSYVPEHPPVDGKIPDVVYRFGPATQIRWFKRFYKSLGPDNNFSDYYVDSEHHRGCCCVSCLDEYEEHCGSVIDDGWCCCRDERIGTE